jgi:isochorismate synthase
MNAAINYNTLKICLQKGLSFAAYTLPHETMFSLIVQKSKAIELNNLSEQHEGFMLHPFEENTHNPILLIKNDFYLREKDRNPELLNFIQAKKNYQIKNTESYPQISKKEYLNQFEQFSCALKKGKYKKLVLSRVENISIDNLFDIITLFKELNNKYHSSFNYLLFTPQSGIWLGASPEILLKVDAEQTETYALAGTQHTHNIISSEYVWDAKEIEEQKIVVDFVYDKLTNHIPFEKIKITNETIEAGNMVHLRSCFSFPSDELKNKVELIKDIHPTPAVCGIPAEETKQFITQTESYNRSYYSGFLGPLNINNQTDLFVNLRCLHMNNNQLSLFVGGGLIIDSIGEKEWEETELKTTTLLSLIKNQL